MKTVKRVQCPVCGGKKKIRYTRQASAECWACHGEGTVCEDYAEILSKEIEGESGDGN